ncbi:MAG: hypothetical protein JSR17_03640 [Proteobacteria bacterium]|nr:hypothetical protein [Pseudomonadota bacterium]
MLNGVLAWVGGFVQQTATTNTAQEIASDIADIHYNNKRGAAIFNLVTSALFMGGGAVLFVLEPSINAYFSKVLLQGFPFLGNIAASVFTGIIGAWFGGGFGTNVAKELERYYEARGGNHTNGEYNISDSTINNIINANPIHINPQDLLNVLGQGAANAGNAPLQAAVQDLEQGLQQGLFNNLHLDQQSLSAMLNEVVNLIDEHRNDGTGAKKELKYALLSATRQLNLQPLNDLYAKNDTKREARVQIARNVANYLGHPIDTAQMNNPADREFAIRDQAPRNAQRMARRRRPAQRAVPAEHVELARAVEVQPAGQEAPLPQQQVGGAPLAGAPNPQAQHQPAPQPPQQLHEEQMVPVVGPFRNTLEYYRNLHSGKVVDPRRSHPITPQDANFHLTPAERAELLTLVQLTVHQQKSKQVASRVTAEPISRVYRGGRRAR